MSTELRLARGGSWMRRGYALIATVTGTVVAAGANLESVIAAGATNDTFVLTAGPTQPYRISNPLPLKQGQTLYSNTGAILLGSVIVSGWVSDGAGHWYKSGLLPADYSDSGVCNINSGSEANPCQRREDIFMDDVQLKRWMTLGSLVSGGFYEDYAANRIYIADNPSGHVFEMSKTPLAIDSSVTNCHLTGLSFQRFASASQVGAVRIGAANWEIDHCEFAYNHACGLHITNANFTHVHDNNMHHNGQLGMAHHSSDNTLIENNIFAYNNYMKDYWALDWESGGFKSTFSVGAVIRNNYHHDNSGVGLWFDIDNVGCTADGNRIEDNISCGIRHEISFDAVIKNNTIRRNGYGHADPFWRNGTDGGPFATAGINVNCSGGGYYAGMGTVEVFGNVLEDNQNGIHIQQRSRGNSGTYPTRTWTTQNVKVHDNTVTMRGRPNDQFAWGSSGISQLTYTDDAIYHTRGNTFSNNTYYLDSLAALRFRGWKTANNQSMSFADFQANGYDLGSTAAVAPRSGFRVISSLDDGFWGDLGTSTYSGTSDRTYIGDFDAATSGRCAWMRVPVSIPQGATVATATLDILPKGINGSVPPMVITAHKSPNSAQPTSRTDVSGRPVTAASINWAPGSWPVGSWLQSADITSVVQEIVNQPAWVSGNFITFLIKPQTLGWSGVQQYITITSYDSDPASAAGLVATWQA